MNYDALDLALMGVLALIVIVCLFAIWYGNRKTKNRYVGKSHDYRDRLAEFRRINGR